MCNCTKPSTLYDYFRALTAMREALSRIADARHPEHPADYAAARELAYDTLQRYRFD